MKRLTIQPVVINCTASAPEADLGMFSMFGRTRAPRKRGPTRGPANFLQHSNMHNYYVYDYDYVMRVLNKMSMMTTLSLCVSYEFSRAIRILGRGPTFLSEQGPA